MYEKKSSLAIGEMKIESTLRFHFTIVRWQSRKKLSINGEDMGKKVHLYIAGGTANWCNHYGKQYGDSSENLEW